VMARVRTDVSAAGSGSSGDGNNGEAGGALGVAGGLASEPKHYPGHGFVVHEWGTDTIVVGSDGSLQRGLHHEEEDLPAFVYDRIKAGTLLGSTPSPSVTIKMETPVTYFYSPTPLAVSARVDFPKGVLTQWYPGVSSFLPPLAAVGSLSYPSMPAVLADPPFDPSFPFESELCRSKYGMASGGVLDWGKFSLLARGAAPEKALPDAPLERFGWSHARAVDANLVQMPSGESERFLFYRGLGEFDLPVEVQAGDGGKLKLTNGYSEAMGQVFLLNVDREHGAFVAHSAGIAPAASLEALVPSLAGAPDLDEYAQRLSDAVTQALDATGLYHDEALAMVNTWRRQWFRTPGVRALYLLPQSWTEQSIPLSISPTPDESVRVMLIRVEVISREQEASDVAALSWFDTDAPRGTAYFSALGRFAEPRLRRALQLSASAAGEQYLSQIASVKLSVASGE
ncbi:MAG TPA: hypothetical protein VFK05_36550, partial [Polyangiaceae bacterium]|nr:hypothetical protein [Polyangiaceae bacterium]